MFLFKFLLPILAFLGLATAWGHKSDVIIHQLENLRNETQMLTKVLDAWDHTMMGAVDVAEQTEKVLEATKNATADIQLHSHKLGIGGAIHVKRVTKKLKRDIQDCNKVLLSFREDFNKIQLAATVLYSLIDQQEASSLMNEAIMPKLPYITRGIGRSLGRKIVNTFQRTIDAYAQMLGIELETVHAC